jgi:phospholipase/lecithinase/hemolysin
MYADPEAYHFDQDLVMSPCLDTMKKTVCSNPQDRIYYDALHPSTAVQRILSTELVKLIRRE